MIRGYTVNLPLPWCVQKMIDGWQVPEFLSFTSCSSSSSLFSFQMHSYVTRDVSSGEILKMIKFLSRLILAWDLGYIMVFLFHRPGLIPFKRFDDWYLVVRKFISSTSSWNTFGWRKEKERCSGSFHLAVRFLVIKDDSISERPD